MNRPRYTTPAQGKNPWTTAMLHASSVQEIVICESNIEITGLTPGVAETSGDSDHKPNKAAENERVCIEDCCCRSLRSQVCRRKQILLNNLNGWTLCHGSNVCFGDLCSKAYRGRRSIWSKAMPMQIECHGSFHSVVCLDRPLRMIGVVLFTVTHVAARDCFHVPLRLRQTIAILPTMSSVSGVTPDCQTAIRIPALVMVAKASAGPLGWGVTVAMRSLGSPLLASLSTSCLRLAPSVITTLWATESFVAFWNQLKNGSLVFAGSRLNVTPTRRVAQPLVISLLSCPLVLQLVCVTHIRLLEPQRHCILFEVVPCQSPMPSPIETHPLAQAVTCISVHVHPKLLPIQTMASTWDIQLSTRVDSTANSGPIIITQTLAAIRLVKIGGGAMSVTISGCNTGRWHSASRATFIGRHAIWTHATVWASEPACAVALAAVRPVQIGGCAMPIAIF